MSKFADAREEAANICKGFDVRLGMIRGRLLRNEISPGDAFRLFQHEWAGTTERFESELDRHKPPLTPEGNEQVRKHRATKEGLRRTLHLACCDLFLKDRPPA